MAAQTLEKLRAADLNLDVNPSGKLVVWPADHITPDLHALIQAHRDALIEEILNQEQDAIEAYEERAGILQHEAGLSRQEAETEAARLVVVRFKLIDPPGDRGGSVISAAATPEQIIEGLRARYGARLASIQRIEPQNPLKTC